MKLSPEIVPPQSVDVDKTAKPPIFGAIGDIALALGPEFDQFAALIMKHLVIFNVRLLSKSASYLR